jgi:hypothetical protein
LLVGHPAAVAHGAGAAQGDAVSQGEQQVFTFGVLHFLTRGALQHFTLRTFGALQQRAASAESEEATMTIAATANKHRILRVILKSPSQLMFGFHCPTHPAPSANW